MEGRVLLRMNGKGEEEPMEKRKAFLQEFCHCCGYPEEATAALTGTLEAMMNTSAFWNCVEQELRTYEAGDGQELYEALMHLRREIQGTGIREESAALVFFILCAGHLRQIYQRRGYAETIYWDTVMDLRRKMEECHRLYGIWGTTVAPWFCGFYSLKRFALGRLQFEMAGMPVSISPDGTQVFKGGEPAVNIHIPSGSPLRMQEVLDSYRQAADFFADQFDGDSVRMCCASWLLFPGHRVMLPESSRIRQFADTFIYMRTEFQNGADILWRIFGCAETADLSVLPRDTQLQRAYIRWLEAGRPIGAGLGVRYEPKPAKNVNRI